MKLMFILLALFASVITTVASPLPREVPFFIVAAASFVLPRNHALLLALCAGILVDFFSPIKGVSACIYPAGVFFAQMTQRHLLTNRSLLAFVLLLFVSGFFVVFAKYLVTFLDQMIRIGSGHELLSRDLLERYLRAGMLNILTFMILYPIVSKVSARQGTTYYEK